MDIDSPDDYEPPPDRIPDRAPERRPAPRPGPGRNGTCAAAAAAISTAAPVTWAISIAA